MKQLIEEGDFVYFIEHEKKTNKVYFVDKVEDLVYDYTMPAAITASALGSFTEVTNLEPKQVVGDGSEIQCYQLRTGIDVGMCYVEMLAGTIRRTPFKQRRPTASAPYVGYFDENDSPFYNPRYEFFLRYNERPSFAVFNRWGFSITPKLAFRGRKLKLFDMDMPMQIKDQIGLGVTEIQNYAKAVRNKAIPARRITVYGMED